MQRDAKHSDYRVWLTEELNKRKAKNPAYSLRSFAKTLRIPASSLSQVLLGKRPLTFKTAEKIAAALGLDPKERAQFMESALRFPVGASRLTEWEGSTLQDLEIDKFKMIAEWHHLAILGLASLKENRFEAGWIADMLSIPKKDASDALQRLERLGFIGKKGLRFQQTTPAFQVTAPKGSASIRRFHKETLQLAEKSLEKDSVDEREFNTMTMAVDVDKLPEAKKRIVKFRNELSSFLETGKQTQVFMLSMQLFPISKKEKVKK